LKAKIADAGDAGKHQRQQKLPECLEALQPESMRPLRVRPRTPEKIEEGDQTREWQRESRVDSSQHSLGVVEADAE